MVCIVFVLYPVPELHHQSAEQSNLFTCRIGTITSFADFPTKMAAPVEAVEALSLGEAFIVLGQWLCRVQEAHIQQTEERTQESLARLEEKTQESLVRVEERTQEILTRLEEKAEAVGRLEEGAVQLEASMKVATGKLLPRLEAVLRNLESSSPTTTTCATPSSSNPLPSALSPVEVVSLSYGAATTPTPPMTSDIRKALGEALCEAAFNGRAEEVKRLLQGSAEVNYRKEDWWNRTPLHVATIEGHVDVMSLLIAAGADAKMQDDDENTPLHFAAHWDKVAAAQALIAAGADVNCKGKYERTPLHDAAFKGHKQLVLVLIAAGARKDIPDNDGKTPCDFAENSVISCLL